ncbi:hypothetical protein B9Z19DRAFT_426765 [Tuber borchii]|uniref:Uncharacterized protein n=1 Tax=Tuber borchii TaxID=42251 RepID=A0A2T7A3R3_TUBBO|nr:hypothetical protein B9Z19DRAFT_426765 [Tuber borchii]
MEVWASKRYQRRGGGERPPNHRPAILTCSTVIYELHPKEAAFAATMLRKREFDYLNPNSTSTRRKRHKSPLLRVPGAALCPSHQLQNLSTDHHSTFLSPLPSFLLFPCNIIGSLLFLLPHSLLVAPSFLRSKVKRYSNPIIPLFCYHPSHSNHLL